MSLGEDQTHLKGHGFRPRSHPSAGDVLCSKHALDVSGMWRGCQLLVGDWNVLDIHVTPKERG